MNQENTGRIASGSTHGVRYRSSGSSTKLTSRARRVRRTRLNMAVFGAVGVLNGVAVVGIINFTIIKIAIGAAVGLVFGVIFALLID